MNVNSDICSQKKLTFFFTVASHFTSFPKSVKKGLNYSSNKVVNVVIMPGGSLKGKVQASMKVAQHKGVSKTNYTLIRYCFIDIVSCFCNTGHSIAPLPRNLARSVLFSYDDIATSHAHEATV